MKENERKPVENDNKEEKDRRGAEIVQLIILYKV